MARTPRQRSWSFAQDAQGRWSVSHGHRVVYDGLSSRHGALQAIASAHRPGEKVFETEPDGYQLDVTGHLVRRGVIAARPSQATRASRPAPTRTVVAGTQRMQMPFVTALGARRPAAPARDPRKR